MFGFGSKSVDDNVKSAVIEATNTESGVSALGGLSTSALKPTPKADNLSDVQKDAISNLFRDDSEYLVLPGSEKERPRSAVFTHTVGMAVCCGGSIGALTGAVAHFNPRLIASSGAIERSQYITMLTRRIRNNAIRFGGFATIMCTTGVAMETLLKEKLPDPPSEEEIIGMAAQGIQYRPPTPAPLDPTTQRIITSTGFIGAAFLVSAPKAYELWKNANKFESLGKAQADAGLIEQQFMKLYSRQLNVEKSKLPGLLRTLAVTKVTGVVAVACFLDYLWHQQMRDKMTNTVRKFSGSFY